MHRSPPPTFYKNPGLAAVLSFFYMGLGQIYNGEIAKGIVFIVVYSLSFVLWLILIGMIITPILWIYGIYDAYKSAGRINEDIARRAAANTSGPMGPPVN